MYYVEFNSVEGCFDVFCSETDMLLGQFETEEQAFAFGDAKVDCDD